MAFDPNRDFADAEIPDVWTIFGITLNHFCEGHKIVLRRIGSPFECGGEIRGRDLATALLICSLRYEDADWFISLKKLPFRARMFIRLIAFCEALNPTFVRARIDAFSQYIEEAERLPKGILRKKTPDGQPATSDGRPAELTYAPQALIQFDLCHHFGWSRSEVLNMPLRAVTMARYRLLEIDKFVRWRPAYYDAPPLKEEATNGV
jgi:hypothetical protein